jgi:hypothetical protein
MVLLVALWFDFAALFRGVKYPDPAAIRGPRSPQLRPAAAIEL